MGRVVATGAGGGGGVSVLERDPVNAAGVSGTLVRVACAAIGLGHLFRMGKLLYLVMATVASQCGVGRLVELLLRFVTCLTIQRLFLLLRQQQRREQEEYCNMIGPHTLLESAIQKPFQCGNPTARVVRINGRNQLILLRCAAVPVQGRTAPWQGTPAVCALWRERLHPTPASRPVRTRRGRGFWGTESRPGCSSCR